MVGRTGDAPPVSPAVATPLIPHIYYSFCENISTRSCASVGFEKFIIL